MKTKYKTILWILFFLALIALSIFYISTHDILVLNPKGFIGKHQRNLMLIASILMLIVVLPVYVMTVFIAWKYRETNKKATYKPDWEHSYVAESVWWGVPFVIIIVLAVITWKSSYDLYPLKPIASENSPIEIQAVALEWKWLFIYPKHGVATVNYIQFPTNTPIHFEITADAPMNSFWIPQLGGQIYAMPAMRSRLNLIADEEGDFMGRSANFSGTGFSDMGFTAKASSEEEFIHWLSTARKSRSNLDFNLYQELVIPSTNNPAVTFKLINSDLFEQILMKYEPPIEN